VGSRATKATWVTRQHGQEGNKGIEATRATGKQSNLGNRANLSLTIYLYKKHLLFQKSKKAKLT